METRAQDYVLDEQVGYLLRLASQRHATIFQKHSARLTPTQFSTLMRVSEHGEVSQNRLGRLAAMDVATIKGVVGRLKTKGLVTSQADLNDRRRLIITLTPDGAAMIEDLKKTGAAITEETLAPLTEQERATLVRLLDKIT